MNQKPIASLHLSSGNVIKIEIDPKEAPNTASSFIWLAQQGAFDGREIRRIVPDFVIQPSYNSFDLDPLCDFMIEGEFRANGFENNLTLDKYAVAMGGDGETLASGSCFFIAVADCRERLDGKYAGFGRVIEGFEEIDRLLGVPLKEVEADIPGVSILEPEVPQRIERVTVETYGAIFGEPVKTTGIWAYERKQLESGAIFEHFKGNRYKLLHIAKDSETQEEMAVYQALYGEQGVWVRPLDMFTSSVKRDGKILKRFRRVD